MLGRRPCRRWAHSHPGRLPPGVPGCPREGAEGSPSGSWLGARPACHQEEAVSVARVTFSESGAPAPLESGHRDAASGAGACSPARAAAWGRPAAVGCPPSHHRHCGSSLILFQQKPGLPSKQHGALGREPSYRPSAGPTRPPGRPGGGVRPAGAGSSLSPTPRGSLGGVPGEERWWWGMGPRAGHGEGRVLVAGGGGLGRACHSSFLQEPAGGWGEAGSEVTVPPPSGLA